MTTINDMPETFGEPLAHEEKESAHVSGPASADDAGDVPAAEKKERRAKVKKEPTATKAARGRKGKATAKVAREAKVTKPKAEKKPDFNIDALEPEVRELVETSVAKVEAIGRKTTENVLNLGVIFHDMAEAIPDEAHWKVAVVRHCKVSWKFADNWKRVHVALGARRAELVQHQVTPTVLIQLLPATSEQVDQVLGAFAAGKPMKVREVQDLVGSGAAPEGETALGTKGGLSGLKSLAAAKAAQQGKNVMAGLKAIQQVVGDAIEASGEKKLKKGELEDAMTSVAKLLQRELTELLCGLDGEQLRIGYQIRHAEVADERWAMVLAVVGKLANIERWPDAAKLKPWMVDEVMPLFAFAIDGTDVAVRSEEQVEVMAAAAEGDGLHGDDVIEPEATSEAEVGAAIDAPTMPEVEPSVEAEAEPAEAVEVKPATAPDVVVAPKPKRFNLSLARSSDVTANAAVADMAEQVSRAEASVIGSNGPV